jgi:hypothetical protein
MLDPQIQILLRQQIERIGIRLAVLRVFGHRWPMGFLQRDITRLAFVALHRILGGFLVL